MASKDLTNQKFGKLTAVSGSRDLSKSDRCLYWECICECGNKVKVRSSTLINGSTKSCGCFREFFRSEKISLPKGDANINSILKNYKQSAKRRKHNFLYLKKIFLHYYLIVAIIVGHHP